jgi:riboflavin biosynthesis pyrimidine reductase
VATLDGVIEVDGRSGPLAGPVDRAAFMAMRAVCDVVLVGAGTVRAENYGPIVLSSDARARRCERGQPELPRLAIVSAQAELRPDARVFSAPVRTMLLTSDWGIAHHQDLRDVADVIVCGDNRVDLGAARCELERRRLQRVCCEGGPVLLRSLLGVGLADELCLTFAPLLAGSGGRRMTGEGPLSPIANFRLVSVLEGDGMLLTRYEKVRKP